MKTVLQPDENLGKAERLQRVKDWRDDISNDSGPETRPEVLEELARRAAWRDSHPKQGKSLLQIAQSLGVLSLDPCI